MDKISEHDSRYIRLYEEMLSRALDLHESNKRRIRRGLICLLILPPVLYAVMRLTDSDRVVFLIIWIICMFVLSAYLISIEYLDDSVQKTLAEMTEEEAEFDDLLPHGEIAGKISGRIEERIVTRRRERAAEIERIRERLRERAELRRARLGRYDEDSDDYDAESRAGISGGGIVTRWIVDRRHRHEIVTYDEPGNGASGQDADDPELTEEETAEILAVLDGALADETNADQDLTDSKGGEDL